MEKIEKSLIIDCHSHIGKDFFSQNEATLEGYKNNLQKQGIDIGILMPVPSSVSLKDSSKMHFGWKFDNNTLTYFFGDKYTGSKKFENPYKQINEYFYNKIKNEPNIHFIPLINALFDTPEYILDIAKRYNPVALKIHGKALAISPELISEKLIAVFKELNLPIIAHTDYTSQEKNFLDKASNMQIPLLWARWFEKHKLKGYFAHGARLCKEAFNIINNDENMVVGLGPDLRYSVKEEDNGHMMQSYKRNRDTSFLEILKSCTHVSKILFDVDYNWNTSHDSEQYDECGVLRVRKVFTPKEQELVLCKNAIRFFGERLLNKNTQLFL